MNTVVQFAALGLGPGSIIALLALGIVVTFRGGGVVNIAHGAYAMFAGYLYWQLGTDGWAPALALAGAVLATALVGLLTDQLILRRLRSASALTRLIATMGVLLLIQAATALIWGTLSKTVTPILPSSPLRIGDVSLPSDRVWLLVIALVATAVITVVWYRTRAGWIAEAVSENQRQAAALGWSPELVSGITWAVGAGLAGVAGILIAPITQLDTSTISFLVVPALAAALIGGFRSFPVTLAGAVLIGVAQSLTGRLLDVTGASDALPFLVIVIGLVIRGTALPLRGDASERLPRVGSGRTRWYLWGPAVAAAAALVAVQSSPDVLTVLTSTFAIAIILQSFVVLVGYTGQVSLAQYSLAGIGALLSARLVADAGWPFPVAVLAGALGAMLVGILVAVPALRTRGVNLTVVTLGLAQAAQSVVFSNPTYAGNEQGILVSPPSLFGWSIDPILHPQRYAIFVLLALTAVALGVAAIRRSRVGRALLAVRDNERAAAAGGINVVAAKVGAFAIAGGIAGLGGALLAFQSIAITFAGYDPLTSISYVAFAVIGGLGFVFGAVFGATFAPQSIGTLISLQWDGISSYILIIGAVGLLVTLVLNPHGWVHEALRLWRRATRRRPAATGATEDPAPTAVDDTDIGTVEQAVPVTLTVHGLTVRYGNNVAVDAVDLEVRPGEIVGLIGPNGAGKTSFMDAITGFTPVARGTVALDGADITGRPAHRRARAGLVRSFQSLELYPDMTLRENVLAAGDSQPASRVARSRGSGLSPRARRTLRELGLAGLLDRLPDELSYGQRRLLAVARAVASGPSVLLLDEPVAGLDDHESAEFATVLRSMAHEGGMGILLIEHDMNFVMSICDRIVVIDFGHRVTEGTPAEIRVDPLAVAAYLGDEPSDQLIGATARTTLREDRP